MLTDVDGLPNEVNGIQSGKSAYRNTFQNFYSVALFTKKKLKNLRKTSNVRKILFLEHDTQKTLKHSVGYNRKVVTSILLRTLSTGSYTFVLLSACYNYE